MRIFTHIGGKLKYSVEIHCLYARRAVYFIVSHQLIGILKDVVRP